MSLVIYVDSPTELTFFPSLLLILTVFRIGLSISTARLILIHGQGGAFIELAGQALIGDNLVVGMIIFSIIAIVNFLVITKGAERVAEVVARFTLDVLPGKQMSIDADLKAGNINLEEAKQRRNKLQIESSLYGALDGSTKFIKGDVISNIIIMLVNLLGGIIIGVYQKGFDMTQAVSTYSILSIGDGLLQQIPITLSSISGGIIVTRVNNEISSGSIGENIKNTLKENNIILLFIGILIFLLLMVDILPKMIILVYCTILLGTFVMFRYKIKGEISPSASTNKVGDFSEMNKAMTETEDNESRELDTSALPKIESWKVYPVIIVLAKNLVKSKKNRIIKKVIESINANLYSKLGIELPQIFITQGGIEDDSYEILVNEVTVASAKLYEDYVLVPFDEISNYIEAEWIFVNEVNLGYLEYGYWVHTSKIQDIEQYGLHYLSMENFLLEHATFVLINNTGELIGFQEIKTLLDQMVEYQDLVKELLRMLPLNKITEVIKRLLVEKIPIRNFKVILDALLEWAPKEKETILLVEYVRISLGRYIGQMFKIDGKIYAIGIDADLEEVIKESIRYTSNGFYLDLVDNFYDTFNEKLSEVLEKIKLKNKIVVITSLNIRKAVSHVIGKKMNVNVLSHEEVSSSNCQARFEMGPLLKN